MSRRNILPPGNWEPKTHFKISDAVLIILLLGAAFFLLYRGFSAEPGGTAIVYLKDTQILQIKLSEDNTYSVQGKLGTVKLQVKNGKLSVIGSNCPHKLCERRGEISKAGEQIVCVPNEISINITGKGEIDEISG